MEKFIADIYLKVCENDWLRCVMSSFYSIYLSESLVKSVTPRKKRGALIGGGALNGKKHGT